MLFNSLTFLIFFAIVYALYLAFNHRWQNRLLLLASYVFYGAWDWRFLSLIWISTILDYFCGIKINEASSDRKRRFYLALSIAGNLSMLGFFKYFNFFAGSMKVLLSHFGIAAQPLFLNIVLPVGISFYTFQTMSYAIDIYRNEMKPTKKFFDFALFVAFFPQLVAGPIERAKRLLHQVLEPRVVTPDKIETGFRLILWGLFKKVVVADRLAIYVDIIYGNVAHHSSMSFLLATFFFAFQIYCDFSGYSDIARGLAKLMGFEIMVNFRSPYFSKNVREFWQRWHISLSSWLRDYLYITLGGNRRGALKTYRNIFITMILGGLWHGANWTFIIWGLLHALYISLSRLFSNTYNRYFKAYKDTRFFDVAKICFTFTIVLLTWVFFRAKNVGEAFYILRSIFSPEIRLFAQGRALLSIVHGIFWILFLLFMEYRKRDDKTSDVLRMDSIHLQWTAYYAVIFAIVLFAVSGGEQFIYFQF